MAEIAKKLHYRRSNVTTNITLYNSTADMGDDYLKLRVDGTTVYAPLGSASESNASGLMIQKDGQTFAVMKNNYYDIPSGFIAIFDTSCPSGWTRETAFDGKFIRGAASYGGTGGAESHTHTLTVPWTSTNYVNATTMVRDYDATTMPEVNHRHKFPAKTVTSDSAGNLPYYINVVFCRKN